MTAIRINREELLRRLQAVQPGLSTSKHVDQSNCFIFQKGYVYTFNGEIAASYVSKLGKELTAAVRAKKVLDLLQKLAHEEVVVELKDNAFVISGSGFSSKFAVEQEIELDMSTFEQPGEWKPLPEQFADAVSVALECTSKDVKAKENKFNQTCVHIHPEWVEAFDNTQAARFNLKTGLEQSVLVKHESIKHILAFGMCEYSQTSNWLHFRNDSKLVLSCLMYFEKFPSLSKMFETKGGTKIRFPKGLVEIISCAEIFTKDEGASGKVRIEIKPGKLRLIGQGLSDEFRGWKSMPSYDGDPMAFLITPKMLAEITKKHNVVFLSEERLRVKGQSFVYLAALDKATSNGKG